MMKTAEVTGFGSVEQLRIREVPIPKPGEGELLIRVKACGLNGADILQREGAYSGGPKPPFFPGIEAAGSVEAHGPGASGPPVGTPVAFITGGGAQAEFVVVKAEACIGLPENISYPEGAGFPVHYLTAYHALTTVARAAPAEWVLIHAGAGGLGTAAVQIAKILGLRVATTASTIEKRMRLTDLGADLVIDYEAFESACRQLHCGGGPGIILDSVGGDVFRRSLALLPPLGRLVVLGLSSRQLSVLDPVRLLFQSKAVLGFHLNVLLEKPDLATHSISQLVNWLREGKIKVQVGHTFALAAIRGAHELLISRKSYGKIVLLP